MDLKRTELVEENARLRRTIQRLENNIKEFLQPPFLVAEVIDRPTKNAAIIRLPNGNEFFTTMVPSLYNAIYPGDKVLTQQNNMTIVAKIGRSRSFNVERFVVVEKPTVTWKDVGGLSTQIQELIEVVELPLKKPNLFKKIGIMPPKGVLLYGPTGTGKTLMAKAVANSTDACFIEVVGSELAQKFIGEGAKLVKDIFDLARDKEPTILFIDELDAIAAKRIEIGTSGEREVQRTFMQLLSELDGFHPLSKVKVIGATNRPDILDPAITRPGRLDRLIEVPLPNAEGRKEIFKIHLKNMNTSSISIQQLVKLTDKMSGAEIRAIATEAGYFAIRENRVKVIQDDFIKAIKKVKKIEKEIVYSMFR
jgi:proteasome regulatory subunit